MCGFAGVIWKRNVRSEEAAAVLARFEPRLVHRGPDERGIHVGKNFAVVHRRLSIIDISAGQQPMLTADGRVGIAYNGEVYNHVTLRRELEADGHKFETHCDTEVVLKLFVAYGPEAFNRLDGMFTIFVWDLRGPEPQYYLARDHLGTKPLYVYEDDARIAFSSEIRPLLALPDADLSLNPAGLQSYLTFRYTHAPLTFYKRIRRLEAGAYCKVSAGRVLHHRFWDLPNRATPLAISEADARDRLVHLLRESVAAQQMSEVPVGLLLSGGLDSSAIAAMCGELGVKLKSFNIGFPDVNEFRYSSEMARAFSLDHMNVETSVADISARFQRVVEAMDDPIADAACFPLHILCDEIAKSVTVVLSGEGADEMLGGYPQYLRGVEASPVSDRDHFNAFLRNSWYFAEEDSLLPQARQSRLSRHASYFLERPLLDGMLAYDLKTWLPENLMMKADKILMSHSLEGRFPFLSKSIAEFFMSLPPHLKIGPEGGKHILRRAFNSRLPSNIINRPKMGFTVPIDQLVDDLRARLYDTLGSLASSPLTEHLDFAAVRRMCDAHFDGSRRDGLRVWTLLVLLQWFSADAARLPTRTMPANRGFDRIAAFAVA